MDSKASSNIVQEEFLRLTRAIYDSLEREGELQRQMRRTKEALVAVAMRLQVAIKMSHEDEVTITSLLTLAQEAKARELVANKKVEEATSIINQLNMEMTQLKRKLNLLESQKEKESSSILSSQQQRLMDELADEEVNQLWQDSTNNINNATTSSTGKKMTVLPPSPKLAEEAVIMNATPYDRWKMEKFLYAPDTPAASEHYDPHVVDMLMFAASEKQTQKYTKYQQRLQENGNTLIGNTFDRKYTMSSLSKVNSVVKAKAMQTSQYKSKGAAEFEGFPVLYQQQNRASTTSSLHRNNVDEAQVSRSLDISQNNAEFDAVEEGDQEDNDPFFLNNSPIQRWGVKHHHLQQYHDNRQAGNLPQKKHHKKLQSLNLDHHNVGFSKSHSKIII